jgi:hypothetical protein
MRQLARLTMTMRDLDRLKRIQAAVDGDLKPGRAAERLGPSSRQVCRLWLHKTVLRKFAANGGNIPRETLDRRAGNRSGAGVSRIANTWSVDYHDALRGDFR